MCILAWSHPATAAPTPTPTLSASQLSEEGIIEVAEHAGEALGVVFALLVIISILCIITKVITWMENTEEGQQFARSSMDQIRQWHEHARGGGFYPGQLTWDMVRLVRIQWSWHPADRPTRARASLPRSSQALQEAPQPSGSLVINLPIAPRPIYGLTARATSNHMRHAIKALPILSSSWVSDRRNGEEEILFTTVDLL